MDRIGTRYPLRSVRASLRSTYVMFLGVNVVPETLLTVTDSLVHPIMLEVSATEGLTTGAFLNVS